MGDPTRTRLRTSDRGVSEILGFVLVFSIVLATVGVAYVAGFAGLEDARDAEQLNNAERAFDVLAENVADISDRGAPSRSTEIKLSDAQLEFGEATTVNVTVTNASGTVSAERSTAPVVYTAAGSDSKVVYENGAVVRVDRGGSTILRDPALQFFERNGNRVAVVPLVELRSSGREGVGGTTTALVRASSSSSGILLEEDGSTPVTSVDVRVETTPERAVAWERYLEERLPDDWSAGDACETTAGDVTCTFDPDEVYVPRTAINVAFS